MKSHRFIQRLKDGTVKQINPFTGTEVWSVPERAGRPLPNLNLKEPKLIEPRKPENYCNFCEGLQKETTPERSRLVRRGGEYKLESYVLPKQALNRPAEFRRISNLFEIVSFDYWKKNYGFYLSPARLKWKKAYMANSEGARHIRNILEYKYRCQGRSEDWIGKNLWSHWQELADTLFGGSHDLIIARHHYVKGACFDSELASAGELSPEEHYQYIHFTLAGIQDIYANNPFVKYASVFQNWLSSAGASFNHLHKQIVGLDEWGVTLEKIVKVLNHNPRAFNDYYVNYCLKEDLVIAENRHALCVASFGERFPTFAIFSKAKRRFPWELAPAEIRDFSNLVHAVHAAIGCEMPCNEEWFFTPRDANVTVPWHILLKWRLNVPAGFEGNTEIYINTLEPWALRDKMVIALLDARQKGKISAIRIGEECKVEPNCLERG